MPQTALPANVEFGRAHDQTRAAVPSDSQVSLQQRGNVDIAARRVE